MAFVHEKVWATPLTEVRASVSDWCISLQAKEKELYDTLQIEFDALMDKVSSACTF